MSNEYQSPKLLPAGGRYQKPDVKWKWFSVKALIFVIWISFEL
jgi:hypothetical protein